VDELDQKCSLLSEQLNESMDEREVMKKKLVEMTDKCKQKLEELQKEKVCDNTFNINAKTINRKCFCHQMKKKNI
jgi:predicted nuclease with TOPRIM domain